jgi:hypothetical protein
VLLAIKQQISSAISGIGIQISMRYAAATYGGPEPHGFNRNRDSTGSNSAALASKNDVVLATAMVRRQQKSNRLCLAMVASLHTFSAANLCLPGLRPK